MDLLDLIWNSTSIAVVSMDVSKTAMFRPFRQWWFNRCYFIFKLLSCPWCLAHWVSLPIVWYQELHFGWVFILVGCSALPMIMIDHLFRLLDKEN